MDIELVVNYVVTKFPHNLTWEHMIGVRWFKTSVIPCVSSVSLNVTNKSTLRLRVFERGAFWNKLGLVNFLCPFCSWRKVQFIGSSVPLQLVPSSVCG